LQLGHQAREGNVNSVLRSILTFGQLLEMVLQVAQGIGDGWGGVRRERHLSWSRVIRGPELLAEGDRRAAVH